MRPAALCLSTILLSSCSSPDSGSSNAAEPVDTTKYEQTWSQDYSSTTCEEWSTAMTEHQQFAAAADILASARNKIDGGTGLPPDDLIRDFQAAVTDSCMTPSWTITDASYVAYTDGAARFAP